MSRDIEAARSLITSEVIVSLEHHNLISADGVISILVMGDPIFWGDMSEAQGRVALLWCWIVCMGDAIVVPLIGDISRQCQVTKMWLANVVL